MNKTSTLKTSTKLFSVLALLLIGVASCSKKNDVTGTAYIQITNASEADSPFDFYVDGSKKTTAPLAYTESSAYVSVNSGARPATLVTAATGATLTTFTITPQPGIYYSIFYFGGNTVAMQDDQTAPQSGKARVRFINLCPAITTPLDFAVTTGAALVTNLAIAANSDYFDVAANSTFTVAVSGTTGQAPLITIPTSIAAGHIYTIYLSGTLQADLQANIVQQK